MVEWLKKGLLQRISVRATPAQANRTMEELTLLVWETQGRYIRSKKTMNFNQI